MHRTTETQKDIRREEKETAREEQEQEQDQDQDQDQEQGAQPTARLDAVNIADKTVRHDTLR